MEPGIRRGSSHHSSSSSTSGTKHSSPSAPDTASMHDSSSDVGFSEAFDQLQHSYDMLMEERNAMEHFYQELEDSSAQQEADLSQLRKTITDQAHIITHLSKTVAMLRNDVRDLSKTPGSAHSLISKEMGVPTTIGSDNLAKALEKHRDDVLRPSTVAEAVDHDVEELKAALLAIRTKLTAKENLVDSLQSQVTSYKEEVAQLRALIARKDSQSTDVESKPVASEPELSSIAQDGQDELRARIEKLTEVLTTLAAGHEQLSREKHDLEELLLETQGRLDTVLREKNDLEQSGNIEDELMEVEHETRSLSLKEQTELIVMKDGLLIQSEMLKDQLREHKTMNAEACHALTRLHRFTVNREKALIKMLSSSLSSRQRKTLLQQLINTSVEREFDIKPFTSSFNEPVA